MSDLVFLTVAQAKTLHRLALEQHGGQDGVRDLIAEIVHLNRRCRPAIDDLCDVTPNLPRQAIR